MSNVIVRVEHMRAAKYCAGASRKWFASAGLDWNDFLTNGIPADKLRAAGNPLVEKVITEAERDG